jgi:predicted nuclease of predicted toxin-antitoxin system
VVDMNLTPDWVPYLQSLGHDAVHWSDVGAEDAPDTDIIDWARASGRAVMTADLDFGIALARSDATAPSVIQLRTVSTLPGRIGPLVARAIDGAQTDLLSGALLTIETGRVRLRPFRLDRTDQA